MYFMPINTIYQAPFIEGNLYHLYNRSHKGLKLFNDTEDYLRFISQIENHIAPYTDIFAFSLLPNHFHLFFRQNHIPLPLYTKNISSIDDFMTESFRKVFIRHTKKINLKYDRYGGLFCTPFKDIHVQSTDYAINLLHYIHWNHVHHEMGETLIDYPFSSYSHYLHNHPTFIKKSEVLEWYGGLENFKTQHELQKDRFIILPHGL